MSLKEVLQALGTGRVVNVLNVLQSLVHAIVDEVDGLRGETAEGQAMVLEAVNKLEDRMNASLSGTRAELVGRIEQLERKVRDTSCTDNGRGRLAGYAADLKE